MLLAGSIDWIGPLHQRRDAPLISPAQHGLSFGWFLPILRSKQSRRTEQFDSPSVPAPFSRGPGLF